MEHLPQPIVSKVEKRIQERLRLAASDLEQLFIKAGVVKSVQVEHIHLPWERLVEVGFNVHVNLT